MTLQERKIGFWKEYTKHSTDNSIFKETLNKKNSDKKDILKYLNSGVKILSVREVHRCVFSGKIFGALVNIYTDGVWIWTEGLIYYLENYDILLPSLFLEHLTANSFLHNLKEEDLSQNEKNKLEYFVFNQINH